MQEQIPIGRERCRGQRSVPLYGPWKRLAASVGRSGWQRGDSSPIEYYSDIPGGEQSALKVAVSGGHARQVEILLEEGADPNGRGYRQHPALMLAVTLQNVQIAKLLLDKGTKIDV